MRFVTKEDQEALHLFGAHRYLCSECPHCDRDYPDWCDEDCECVRCNPRQQDYSFTNYCCIECSADIFKNNLEIYTPCSCDKKNKYHKKREDMFQLYREEILEFKPPVSSKKKKVKKNDINEGINKSRDQRHKAVQFLFNSMPMFQKMPTKKS